MMRLNPGHLLLAALILSTISCGKGNAPERPKERPPAPVVTAVVATRTIPVVVEAIGNVESLAQVAIKSMVSAEIKKVHFAEGKDVAQGDVLFTLDAKPIEVAIRKGEADLGRIRAQLATARANAERYGRLVKDGIVTAEQYDSFRTQAVSLEADLASQQANIDAQKVQLSYCTIRSPIAGRTGNLLITAGNVVKANDTLSLVTINQITPIAVTFTVPEAELPRIRASFTAGTLPVEALPAGDSGRPESGRVSFIDNTVDTTTGSIKLKATFQNASRRLWPGQFATVRMTLATLQDAVIVPSQAVQAGQQGQYVFVVKEDATAELRPVKGGTAADGMTVIEQGLKPGETVVIDGHIRIAPGAKVEVRQPGQGAKANAAAQKPVSSAARGGQGAGR
jgi:membrane fusion protein, multidrug efflux system